MPAGTAAGPGRAGRRRCTCWRPTEETPVRCRRASPRSPLVFLLPLSATAFSQQRRRSSIITVGIATETHTGRPGPARAKFAYRQPCKPLHGLRTPLPPSLPPPLVPLTAAVLLVQTPLSVRPCSPTHHLIDTTASPDHAVYIESCWSPSHGRRLRVKALLPLYLRAWRATLSDAGTTQIQNCNQMMFRVNCPALRRCNISTTITSGCSCAVAAADSAIFCISSTIDQPRCICKRS